MPGLTAARVIGRAGVSFLLAVSVAQFLSVLTDAARAFQFGISDNQRDERGCQLRRPHAMLVRDGLAVGSAAKDVKSDQMRRLSGLLARALPASRRGFQKAPHT